MVYYNKIKISISHAKIVGYIVKSCLKICARRHIRDLFKPASYPMVQNVHMSVAGDRNETCYNKGRCCWASL